MQLTREQIKTMIREEIEEALKINKRGKKPNLVTRKQQALSGPTASPKDALKGDTAAPDDEPSDEEKQQAARDKLYSRTQGAKMKGYTDPVTGKKKIKAVSPETEDDRLRRQQDSYIGEQEDLEELSTYDGGNNPLYSRHKGSKMKGYTDPVTGKKKIKLVAPETEDDRQRREQDLYREELQERIFKDLVAKIRGDK